MAPICLEQVQLFQLPKEKTVLWDHTGCGRPKTLHIVAHQKPKIFIKEKILQLALKHLQSHPDGHASCYFLGSTTTNGPSSVGFSIVLNKFDNRFSYDDEFIVPVAISYKTKGEYQWDIQEYLSDLEALSACTSKMTSLDISQFLKLRIQCSYYGIQSEVRVELATIATAFTATPICSVPMLRTELSEYLSKSKDFVPHSGFLVMDTEKRLIVIPETDPKLPVFPLIGIWVSGVSSILHPVVWAACVRYVTCELYKQRLCLPPLPFLLVLYHPEIYQPTFHNCISEGQNQWPVFSSFEGQASAELPKIPVMNSKMLLIDLFPLNDKSKELDEATKQIEKRKLPRSPPVIGSNAVDIPQPSHKAPKIFEIKIDPQPQVSDLSFDTQTVMENSSAQHRGNQFQNYSNFHSTPIEPPLNYSLPPTLVSQLENKHHSNHLTRYSNHQCNNAQMNQITSNIANNGMNFDSNMLGNCGFKAIANMSNSSEKQTAAIECFGLSGNIINENEIVDFVSPYGHRMPDGPCMIQAHASVLQKMPQIQQLHHRMRSNQDSNQQPEISCNKIQYSGEDIRDDLPKQRPSPNQSLGQIIQFCNGQTPGTVSSAKRNLVQSTLPPLEHLSITEPKPMPKSCLKKTSKLTRTSSSENKACNSNTISSVESKKKPTVKKPQVVKTITKPIKKAGPSTNTHIPIKINSNLHSRSKPVGVEENILKMIQSQGEVLNTLQDRLSELLDKQSSVAKPSSKTVTRPEKTKPKVLPQPKKNKTKDEAIALKKKVSEDKIQEPDDVMISLQEQREKIMALENQIKALMPSPKSGPMTENKQPEKTVSTPDTLKVSNARKMVEQATQNSPNIQVGKISCTAATMTSFTSPVQNRGGHNSRYFCHKASMFNGSKKFVHSTAYPQQSSKQPEENSCSFEVDLDSDNCYSMCLEQQIHIDDEPHSPERPIVIDLPEHPDAVFYSGSLDMGTYAPNGHSYPLSGHADKTTYRHEGLMHRMRPGSDHAASIEEPDHEFHRQYPQNGQILCQRKFFSSNGHEMEQVDRRHIHSKGPKHISIVRQSYIITQKNRNDPYNQHHNLQEEENVNHWNRRPQGQAYRSDFTKYGLTGPSMSFATRCYLENYGLKKGNQEHLINEHKDWNDRQSPRYS